MQRIATQEAAKSRLAMIAGGIRAWRPARRYAPSVMIAKGLLLYGAAKSFTIMNDRYPVRVGPGAA